MAACRRPIPRPGGDRALQGHFPCPGEAAGQAARPIDAPAGPISEIGQRPRKRPAKIFAFAAHVPPGANVAIAFVIGGAFALVVG